MFALARTILLTVVMILELALNTLELVPLLLALIPPRDEYQLELITTVGDSLALHSVKYTVLDLLAVFAGLAGIGHPTA